MFDLFGLGNPTISCAGFYSSIRLSILFQGNLDPTTKVLSGVAVLVNKLPEAMPIRFRPKS